MRELAVKHRVDGAHQKQADEQSQDHFQERETLGARCSFPHGEVPPVVPPEDDVLSLSNVVPRRAGSRMYRLRLTSTARPSALSRLTVTRTFLRPSNSASSTWISYWKSESPSSLNAVGPPPVSFSAPNFNSSSLLWQSMLARAKYFTSMARSVPKETS